MDKRGMTLLELMFVTALLTLVVGTLFLLAQSLAQTVNVLEAKVIAHDQARGALRDVTRELRQAANVSIAIGESGITYRVATDVDHNGTAVDTGIQLELGAQRTIGLDLDDLNRDGFTDTQLIQATGEGDAATVKVLCNDLRPMQDIDGDGTVDMGVEFSLWQNTGLLITLHTQKREGPPRGPVMSSQFSEIVFPRN